MILPPCILKHSSSDELEHVLHPRRAAKHPLAGLLAEAVEAVTNRELHPGPSPPASFAEFVHERARQRSAELFTRLSEATYPRHEDMSDDGVAATMEREAKTGSVARRGRNELPPNWLRGQR